MIVSKLTLIALAAFTWYGGGIALFLKAGALIKEAYTLNPVSFWIYLAPILGITIGLIKTLLIFNHACKKNVKRIQSLTNPKVWQFFRPGQPCHAWQQVSSAGCALLPYLTSPSVPHSWHPACNSGKTMPLRRQKPRLDAVPAVAGDEGRFGLFQNYHVTDIIS